MKTYYLKIREKFISEICAGIKKHEYRLASPERLQAKVGDTLVLISNQNKKIFIKTTIKAVRIYKSWKEALQDNWQEDFKNLYTTLDEALHECYKFYRREEVEQYGIVSFDIEPIKTDYVKCDVLLDTNIVIKRESSKGVSFEVAKLFNWFGNKNIKTFVHPLTKKELEGYKDETVKATILTKLNSYDFLPSFATDVDAYFNSVISRYSSDKNGQVDNALIREVYNDNVGLLLTDDNLILKKAEELYIRDRVLTSAELLAFFEKNYPQNIEYKMLAVKLKNFDEVDLNSEFFDTLREDYEGRKFDNWFKRKGKEKAYVFEEKNELKGFLYVKVEFPNEPDYLKVTPNLSPKKRLKVGTFKIKRTGFRLGERFLKIIFDNARNYGVDEIYVTLFEDKRDDVKALQKLMEQWGFKKYGYKDNGETVLVKSMEKYDILQDPKYNYPLLKNNIQYFFLPIYPEYHTDLFPDMILRNENMHLYQENIAHRYAIEKIYLTGSPNIAAKPGDVVLIYRTGERYPKKYSSVVSGIAIIQEIHPTKNVKECIEICKNRSIFSEDEIRKQHCRRPTVVKLLDYIPFKNKVKNYQLFDYGIIQGGTGPRSFATVSKEHFEIIYKLGMEE
ncbi:MAG: ASCH domain-containing protein [Eubacterium sp.]